MDIASVALFLCNHRRVMKPEKPYIGVAYYPEAWPESEVASDIARMTDIGVNLVRMAEFAWSRMEPEEGTYDFAWLHRAVAAAAEAGLAVVLCTPTATPPIWLSERHPDILRVNALGLQVGHGGRRHYCPNSAAYRAYSRKITERMGQEFARASGIVAWQIDNEFFEDCYCDQCEAAFHVWLKARFGTIDSLNQAWNTVLWSQAYQRFDQIPLPNPHRVGASHHPSLVRAYRHFLSDSYASYCAEQVAVLRQYTPLPITTNAHWPVAHHLDYEALFKDLDFVSTDSYADPTALARYAFESDWMRPLKNKPFWFMETASTYSGGTAAWAGNSFAHYPGSLRAKMWLMYSLGAESVCFWLWRGHWAGQEMEHGSLIYPWGEERVNTGEVRQVAAELAQHGDWLISTFPKPAEVAVHYTVSMQWIFDNGSIAGGFRYDPAITQFHKLLAENGIARDMISPEHSVEEYKVVCSPFLTALDANLIARMQKFVEEGGVWVLGPLSACRTPEGTAHQDAAYGAAFEEWPGIHVRHRLPALDKQRLTSEFGEASCGWWCDTYELRGEGEIIARYAGAPIDGLPAIVERQIGRGRVILLGTLPDDEWLGRLLNSLALAPDVTATPGVVVTSRVHPDGTGAGWIAVNTSNVDGSVRSVDGNDITLPPFGVLISSKGKDQAGKS